MGLPLELQYPQPVGVTETGSVHDRKKFSGWIKKVNKSRGCAEIESERWQGKLIAENGELDEEWFAWLSDWKTAPIKTVAGLQELNQNSCQLSCSLEEDQDFLTVIPASASIMG